MPIDNSRDYKTTCAQDVLHLRLMNNNNNSIDVGLGRRRRMTREEKNILMISQPYVGVGYSLLRGAIIIIDNIDVGSLFRDNEDDMA